MGVEVSVAFEPVGGGSLGVDLLQRQELSQTQPEQPSERFA